MEGGILGRGSHMVIGAKGGVDSGIEDSNTPITLVTVTPGDTGSGRGDWTSKGEDEGQGEG